MLIPSMKKSLLRTLNTKNQNVFLGLRAEHSWHNQLLIYPKRRSGDDK